MNDPVPVYGGSATWCIYWSRTIWSRHLHVTLDTTEQVAASAEGSLIVTVQDAVQPFASVTVNVILPATILAIPWSCSRIRTSTTRIHLLKRNHQNHHASYIRNRVHEAESAAGSVIITEQESCTTIRVRYVVSIRTCEQGRLNEPVPL